MPFISVEQASERSFDYIVIGGGTAGLAAAVRLAEDSSASVLVLEAGNDHLNDPKIEIPGQFGQTVGNPEYDWAFSTIKQKNVHDRELVWSRGKGLGGTSAMNFYAWIKPPAVDIDAFEKLGNPGWNWKDYETYSKKTETFHPPAAEVTDYYPHSFNLENRGSTGPVQVTIAPHFHTVDAIFQEALGNKGLNAIPDPYGGEINGTWIASANLDPKTWTRSSSAAAYLIPNINRANLFVLTSALVSRVILDTLGVVDHDIRAKGVEFIHGGNVYNISVNKEIVLSAGAVKSPQILELSGIGRPSLLSEIGVELKIDLPGVGENVQEHIFNTVSYELDPGTSYETLDLLLDPVYAAKAKALHTLGQGVYRNSIASFAYFPLQLIEAERSTEIIEALEEEINSQESSGAVGSGLAEQLRLQLSVLKDETAPDCEVVLYPGAYPGDAMELGKAYLSVITLLNHPVSRGSIHSQTKDPAAHPIIDPRYLDSEIDLDVLTQNFKFTRQLLEVEPWKSAVHREIFPGSGCQIDLEIREFVKKNLRSAWHTVGSCSMLPRSKQGVVDSHLKVYGTTNLRVADLSIVPIHIAAHTQATAYVIGEKVADFIKADKIRNC